MPQIREQIAMVHLPPSKTLKYLFHVRKTAASCRIQYRNLLLRVAIFLYPQVKIHIVRLC